MRVLFEESVCVHAKHRVRHAWVRGNDPTDVGLSEIKQREVLTPESAMIEQRTIGDGVQPDSATCIYAAKPMLKVAAWSARGSGGPQLARHI